MRHFATRLFVALTGVLIPMTAMAGSYRVAIAGEETVSAVPEPAAIAVFAVGALVVGSAIRRRKN